MSIRLISLYKAIGHLLIALISTTIGWGATTDYIAFFSAEQEGHRRLLIDGIADRRVQVRFDSLGQAEVRVWGVDEKEYVGRRIFEKGFLVPVTVRVDFPRGNLMAIKLTGTRFQDFVRFKVMDSDIYIIDLYTKPLPRESYFREETVTALWPEGRFNPDIHPLTTPVADLSQEDDIQPIKVSRVLAKGMVPYRRVVRRAVIWAGCLSGLILISSLPLIWLFYKRRVARAKSVLGSTAIPPPNGVSPSISDPRIRAIMNLNRGLSYDEASLLAAVGGRKTPGRAA
ncbi:hypothetical protein ACFL5M_03505 [Candidatus Neomarinimicrobiota bacterium]